VERLRKRADFERVYREGRRVRHPIATIIARRRPDGALRFAVVAGRRLGGAVVRNRLRRRIRETGRTLLAEKAGWDLIVLPTPGALRASPAELRAGLGGLLRQLGVLTAD